MKGNRIATFILLLGQVFVMTMLALFATYDTVMPADDMMDVMQMMVIGMGYVGTLLNYYSFGSMGMTLLVSSVGLQFGILYEMILNPKWQITFKAIARGATMAFAPHVAMGATLGRMSFLQIVIQLYVVLFSSAAVRWASSKFLYVVDGGCTLPVHVYSALFGMMVSKILKGNVQLKPGQTRIPRLMPADETTYDSELHSIFGTMFVFVFFPSFHAAHAFSPLMQFRCLLNTVLALAGACVGGLVFFGMFYSGRKMLVYGVMSACVAGGVAISAISSLSVQPGPSAVIGTVVSFIVALMHRRLLPELLESDTLRIRIVHFVPGVISALLPIPFILLADKKDYYKDFDLIFPGMKMGGAIIQAAYQLAAVGATLFAALVGGTFTGLVLSCRFCFAKFADTDDLYKDRCFFVLPKTVN